MRRWLKRLCGLREAHRGQTTTEYAIIVALVAVSSIAVILIFGDQIRALFAAEAKRLASEETVEVENVAEDRNVDEAVGGSIKEF